MTAEATIAADDLARFQAQGYLVLHGLTTEEEVVGLQSIYDRLFDPATTIAEEDRVELAGGAAGMLPQILNPDRYAPELRDSPAFRNAEQAARSLLGPKAKLMGLHALRKPPRSGAPTPWHQDEAYWDPPYRHRAVSIWIPLQTATAANGCLSFLPGSHRDGLRDHELFAFAHPPLGRWPDSPVSGHPAPGDIWPGLGPVPPRVDWKRTGSRSTPSRGGVLFHLKPARGRYPCPFRGSRS
jgi:ectoine hydroxylase-related dioxygenase (phytanoyl-CoA dioxygenase family)